MIFSDIYNWFYTCEVSSPTLTPHSFYELPTNRYIDIIPIVI